MSEIILYHGSPEIIQTPVFGKGKSYNDYGKGFYCTEHLELAKEWACTENTDGYVNKYEMNTADLSFINLSSSEYTILHWLALLMKYRKFRISTPVMKRGAEYLKEHFLIDLSRQDMYTPSKNPVKSRKIGILTPSSTPFCTPIFLKIPDMTVLF